MQNGQEKTQHIAERLKVARKLAGLTQKEAAERVGVAWGTLQNWEYGRSAPTIAASRSIAEVYCVDPDWLIDGVGNPRVSPEENVRRRVSAILSDPKLVGVLRKALDIRNALPRVPESNYGDPIPLPENAWPRRVEKTMMWAVNRIGELEQRVAQLEAVVADPTQAFLDYEPTAEEKAEIARMEADARAANKDAKAKKKAG